MHSPPRRIVGGGRRGRGSRTVGKPVHCPFCGKKAKLDYKDGSALSRYISSQGKIMSRRRTKACAKHQRILAEAIKRARFLAMLPYTPSHIWKTGAVGLHESGG